MVALSWQKRFFSFSDRLGLSTVLKYPEVSCYKNKNDELFHHFGSVALVYENILYECASSPIGHSLPSVEAFYEVRCFLIGRSFNYPHSCRPTI